MNKVFLGLDYGTQRVGLSIAFGPLAEPLYVVATEKILEVVKKVILEKKVTDLVVGISEGDMADKTKVFCKKLEAEFHLPIHFQNEALSSYEVQENLMATHASKTKRRGHIDHLAAAAFLQDFLDEYLHSSIQS